MFSANFEHPQVLGRFFFAFLYCLISYSKTPRNLQGFQSCINRSFAPKRVEPSSSVGGIFDNPLPGHIVVVSQWRLASLLQLGAVLTDEILHVLLGGQFQLVL